MTSAIEVTIGHTAVAHIPGLTGSECGDIAITAAEGGIGFWSVIDRYDFERWSPTSGPCLEVSADFVFYAIECENPVEEGTLRFDITPRLIRRGFEVGLGLALDNGGWLVRGLLAKAREDWTGEIDSEGADMLIQFGCFGELTFS